jgi:hypothetical protein
VWVPTCSIALALALERMDPNLCRPNNGFLYLMDLDTNPGLAVAPT